MSAVLLDLEVLGGEKMTKLKQMRTKAGLSQSQLAKKTGIQYRTLQYYEQGKMNFDHARMDKIISAALALNCNISDIIEDPEIIKDVEEYQKTL